MPKYYEMGFKMTKFPQIFREADFPPPGFFPQHPQPPQQTRPLNTTALPGNPTPPEPPSAPSSAPSSAVDSRSSTPVSTGPGASWADFGKGVPRNKIINIAPNKRLSGPTSKRYYLVNKDGERIDEQLRTPHPELFERYNARIRNENHGLKYCNTCNFFGQDKCTKTGDYKHGPCNLQPPELEVYRFVARTSKCPLDLWCDSFTCPYSHNCKFGSSCDKGHECRFATTHHMNRVRVVDIYYGCCWTDRMQVPCKKIYEDGTSEVVK